MSEMIERVAMALKAAGLNEDHDVRLSFATAAIEAMREPTRAMIRETGNCQGCEPENWHRMIDAALEDTP
jgi:hypothetical protein